MKTCKYCGIDNNDNAQFCRNCGKPLSSYNSTWWKEYNMEPVITYKLKRSVWHTIIFILLSFVFASIAYFAILAICLGIAAVCREGLSGVLGSVVGIVMLGAVFLLLRFIYRSIGDKVFVNKYKFKIGFLNSDYIQKYKSRNEHYVFFARGTRDLHKFGLFDVQKIKIQLQPIYDKLEWVEKGKILSATKDGKNFIIDVNGNQYS